MMRLVNIPSITAYESPASWLTRVALLQGIEFAELHQYLGLDDDKDVDFGFTPDVVQSVSTRLGLRPSVFEFAQRMMASIRTIDSSGEKYLLWRGIDARYRFCPACLALSREKTFPIHWRVSTWRYCPMHRCLMLDACPHCSASPVLPASLISAGKDRGGLPLLDRCMVCGESLTHDWATMVGSLDPKLLSDWEISILKNGRAVLAALHWRYLNVYGENRRSRLNRLNDLYWAGALPGRQFILTPDELQRRRKQGIPDPRSHLHPQRAN